MQDQIAATLKHITGNSILSISTVTPVKLVGGLKNPLQGHVQKRMTAGNVMIFSNCTSNGYENMVNRRLMKAGFDAETFQVGKRSWGVRIPFNPFIFHSGKLYLEVIFLNSPSKIEYLLDGKVVDESEVTGLPKKRSEGYQGGLEDKVIIRTYLTANIKQIKIDGKEYNF